MAERGINPAYTPEQNRAEMLDRAETILRDIADHLHVAEDEDEDEARSQAAKIGSDIDEIFDWVKDYDRLKVMLHV
jgi:hypothetical protein